MSAIQLVRFAKDGGQLTKKISLSEDGKLCVDGSRCLMTTGSAQRVHISDVGEFATLIGGLHENEAIALGGLRPDFSDNVKVVTDRKLQDLNGEAATDLISRTAAFITYSPGTPAFALSDFDRKGMPLAVDARLKDLGGFHKALISVCPAIADAARVMRRSTSTGIYRSDTGDQFQDSGGLHLYLLAADGADIPRFLRDLHARCWLAGLGWLMVGSAGQLLERSAVDRSVGNPERLVFEAAPTCVEPLAQDPAGRAPKVWSGKPLDTRTACPQLNGAEQAEYARLRSVAERALGAAAAQVRATYVAARTKQISGRLNVSEAAARQMVERQFGGILLPGVDLVFDDPDMEGATVADVLADPDKYVGQTLADPLEGIAYGRCKARIMRRTDGTFWINSFAHGRTTYDLKHDAASIERAIMNVKMEEAADLFVRLMLAADLQADEEQRLRGLACELSGVKVRPMTAKLTEARNSQRQQRAQEERGRRAAERTDPRPQIPVPLDDAPWKGVMDTINHVLSRAKRAEPPMRNTDGFIAVARSSRIPGIHQLAEAGVNQTEEKPAK